MYRTKSKREAATDDVRVRVCCRTGRERRREEADADGNHARCVMAAWIGTKRDDVSSADAERGRRYDFDVRVRAQRIGTA
jgi:hypothetical protein